MMYPCQPQCSLPNVFGQTLFVFFKGSSRRISPFYSARKVIGKFIYNGSSFVGFKQTHFFCQWNLSSEIPIEQVIYVNSFDSFADSLYHWNYFDKTSKSCLLYFDIEDSHNNHLLITYQCQAVYSYMCYSVHSPQHNTALPGIWGEGASKRPACPRSAQ